MNFNDMKIVVPNEKKIAKKLDALTNDLINAATKEEAIKVVKKFNKFEDEIQTEFTLISIHNSIDTRDEFYENAMEACNNLGPILSNYETKFQKAMVESKFVEALKEEFGTYLFDQIEARFKVFDEKIIPEMQKENKLVTEYEKLMASAKIEWDGDVLNLTQISKYLSDKDKNVRERAAKLYYGFLEEHDEEFGDIYDQLVKTRDAMAKKLGFKNYIEMGYLNLGRLDYNAEMVKGYREQIIRDVVPVVKKLKKRQAQRLGIKHPSFLDFNLDFLSGNPVPAGDSTYLVSSATKMYNEMSKETGEFFNFMVTNELMDLDAKPGKQGGGYMTQIPLYKSPFIFANSNGTSHDVDTLTHEVGHAFQYYVAANIKVPSYRSPTLEACEIHSMSMEFFAWPWMELFFGDEADKYRYHHLAGAIDFLPYGAEVDDFQHFVYEHPELGHKERCEYWAKLEKIYQPYLDFKGYKYLEEGKRWIRQSHIFGVPFYYIDYTLAQVLALQFKCEMDKDREKAFKKYMKLLKLGGKYPFLTLLEKAHLRNPFIDGNVKKVIKPQVKVLDSFDDMSF